MSFPDIRFWSHLLTTLGVEVCCVAALGFVTQLLFRSAVWRRTVWQITVICLLLLTASDLTGFGRGTAGFLFGHKRVVEKEQTSSFMAGEPTTTDLLVAAKLNHPPVTGSPALWWPGWIWLAGAVTVLGRMAAAQILLLALRFRRQKISIHLLQERVMHVANCIGLRRTVGLLRMPKAISPMAFGMLRPSIGLPPGFEEKLSATEQEAVLAHELAHLAAMDPMWFLLADFASALLWWHPLVWWVRRSLHSTAELAADEATALVPDGPDALAKCLVSLGREMTAARGWGWVGINGDFRSQLGKRVERLMRMSGDTSRPLMGWIGVATSIVAMILIVPTIVLLFGALQSAHGQKADGWRNQLQESWNTSPGALLMLAALDDKPAATNQVHTVLSPNSGEAGTLYTKAFKVDPKTFIRALENVYAANFNTVKSTEAIRTELDEMLKAYFIAAGATLADPGKMVFFNDRLGVIMVRASMRDLEIIQQSLELLNQPPPQLTIEAKFVEMDEASLQLLGFGWAKPVNRIDVILTDAQFRMALNTIKQRTSMDILSAPKVTTLSGRQTHISSSNKNDGEIFDSLAVIRPDGYSIEITTFLSMKRGNQTWGPGTFTRRLLDGQTLAIGSITAKKLPDANNVLLVFVTPTIIDSAGNRMHTDKEISNAARRFDSKK